VASSQLIFENITCLCIIKLLIDHWMIRVPIRVNLIQSFIFILIFTKWRIISILNIIGRNRACLHLADLGCVIFLCSFPSSRHVWNKAPFTDWWRSFVVYIVGCVGSKVLRIFTDLLYLIIANLWAIALRIHLAIKPTYFPFSSQFILDMLFGQSRSMRTCRILLASTIFNIL